MRSISLITFVSALVSLAGCSSEPSNPAPPAPIPPVVSLLSVDDARGNYDALTDTAEQYRQQLIGQRTLANVASLEVNSALREWNDPFLEPLAKPSVKRRTWDAIRQYEQFVSDYAPTGMSVSSQGRPRSLSSLTPESARARYIVLKREQNRFRDEHLGRYTRISSSRNKLETSIDEWEANLEEPDIAVFFQSEVGEYVGELTQIVSAYKPSIGA